MPTLFKLIAILLVIGCLIVGGMIALVALVQPEIVHHGHRAAAAAET